MCATFLHTSPLFLHTHFNILFVMAYKKNPKKKDALSIKRAVESLCFQIDWGLKLLGAEKGDLFHQLAKVEVDFISELNLTQDILAIKRIHFEKSSYPKNVDVFSKILRNILK